MTELTEAKIAVEIERARLMRLEFRQRSGALVDRDEVEREVFTLFRAVRDILLSWPAAVSSELAAKLECEPHALGTALDDAVRQLVIKDLAPLGDEPIGGEAARPARRSQVGTKGLGAPRSGRAPKKVRSAST